MYPSKPADVEIRATIGGSLVKQPYSAALLNVSAMSYGALSDNAILALSRYALRDHACERFVKGDVGGGRGALFVTRGNILRGMIPPSVGLVPARVIVLDGRFRVERELVVLKWW